MADFDNEELENLIIPICVRAASEAKIELLDRIKKGISCFDSDRIAIRSLSNSLRRQAENNGIGIKLVMEDAGIDTVGNVDNTIAKLLIDPLDGTLNFSRGLPFSYISIGIFQPDAAKINQIKACIIQRIDENELYIVNGSGEVLYNGRVFETNETRQNRKMAISLAIHSLSNIHIYASIEREIQKSISKETIYLRTYGASVAELIFLSLGKIDLYMDIRSLIKSEKGSVAKPYDICSGYLLVKSRGLYISNAFGDEVDFNIDISTPIHIVASADKELHMNITDILHEMK